MRRTEVGFDGFVHVRDGALVDGRARPLVMRGVGLGGWMLPEGYMWRFPREGPQSPRQIEALITDLVGDEVAEGFWRRYRERFIAEADIERIAVEGFDHVRLPMNARLMIDEDGGLIEAGFALVDRLIEWCRAHRLWVVLDLHGAPGGQTGTNIDDSPAGRPDLFLVGGRYRELTVALWTAIARRYRDETVVAAYDLLNEPLPHEHGRRHAAALAALYRDLTRAIRAVDPHHLITYEGTEWSTNWDIFTQPFDPNSMLQFHKYWSPPDRPSIARFIEAGARLRLPIYMGEGGENHPDWLATAFGMYEDLGISWNFWPWKKLDTRSSPVSIRRPTGWDGLVGFAGGGPRPDRVETVGVLDSFLDGLALEACDYHREIVNALFHRVPVRLGAQAFGFAGPGRSYATTRGTPMSGFRSDDAVTIRPVAPAPEALTFDYEDEANAVEPRFCVVLDDGDWVEYTVEVDEPAAIVVSVEVRFTGRAPRLTINATPVSAELVGGHLTSAPAGPFGSPGIAVRVQAASDATTIDGLTVTLA